MLLEPSIFCGANNPGQNDHFSLNVINQLKEASMLRSTAIVSVLP